MRTSSRARLLRIPLEADVPAHRASLLVRGDQRPFTLAGAWAGGGALGDRSRSRSPGPMKTPSTSSTCSRRWSSTARMARSAALVRLSRLRTRGAARAGAPLPASARAVAGVRARLRRPPAPPGCRGPLVVRGALDRGARCGAARAPRAAVGTARGGRARAAGLGRHVQTRGAGAAGSSPPWRRVASGSRRERSSRRTCACGSTHASRGTRPTSSHASRASSALVTPRSPPGPGGPSAASRPSSSCAATAARC